METILPVLIFWIAFFYSFVGHGGASGYLLVLALSGFNPEEMSQSALVLNILVSSIAFLSFWKNKYFNSKLFFLFILSSIPFSFIGGMFNVSSGVYKFLLFVALLFVAFRLTFFIGNYEPYKINIQPDFYRPIIIGSVIGFVSGIIGIGGGIFLSPILILMNWTDSKTSAGISSAFILVNSISGLLGKVVTNGIHFIGIYSLIFFAFIGGLIGSFIGSRIAKPVSLNRILAFVIVIAAMRLII